MARIQKTKNTVLPAWKVSWYDTDQDMSRSKAIRDYDDALKFKALVEANEEAMPTIGVLSENGLIQYAEWVSPKVFVEMQKMIDECESDEEVARKMRDLVHHVVYVR